MARFMAGMIAAASCLLVSSTAMAAATTSNGLGQFFIFEEGYVVGSYIQQLVPTPTSFVTGEGTTVSITDGTGVFKGDTFLNYFNANYQPDVIGSTSAEIRAGIYDENAFDVAFVQAYTGPESAPVFSTTYFVGGFDGFTGVPVVVSIEPYSYKKGSAPVFLVADVPSAVPEPSTWAMMLIGMGIAGLAQRRRQSASRALT